MEQRKTKPYFYLFMPDYARDAFIITCNAFGAFKKGEF